MNYKLAAEVLDVDEATIKAVKEVESSGCGFLATKEPVILFEPHIFWKQLKLAGVDPNKYVQDNEDILYPVWGSKPYGGASKQHARLERACKIHRNAALQSASWGAFQIMGFNWRMCGCDSIQGFVNKMYQDEDVHLMLFCRYIKAAGLEDELQNKDWAGFARGYNGPAYTKNNYDGKLKAAYQVFSSQP